MKSEEQVRAEEPRARKSRRELRHEREREKRKRGVLEYAIIVVVAFVLVFGVIKPLVIEAFRVPSESMLPTLEVQDRFLANKFIYRFTEPERGDIVVFDAVQPNAEGEFDILVKRVVGLPGDVVQVQGGTLLVNGEPQSESYLNTDVVPDVNTPYGPKKVPEGTFFALGDNRGNSLDSRFYGPVPMENLKGEAFLRFWPFGRAEVL